MMDPQTCPAGALGVVHLIVLSISQARRPGMNFDGRTRLNRSEAWRSKALCHGFDEEEAGLWVL